MTLDFLRFSHYYYTNRSEESLDKYLVEINRIPMITPDQEVELAQIKCTGLFSCAFIGFYWDIFISLPSTNNRWPLVLICEASPLNEVI